MDNLVDTVTDSEWWDDSPMEVPASYFELRRMVVDDELDSPDFKRSLTDLLKGD